MQGERDVKVMLINSCFISGDCGGHLSAANSSSCSGNHEVSSALWHLLPSWWKQPSKGGL